MKRTLFALALFAIGMAGRAQISHEGTQFSAADVAKANTAASAAGMAQMDKDIVTLCNLARLDGTRFWNSFAAPYLGGTSNANTVSLKADLAAVKGLPMLQVDASLQKAAAYHAADLGATGETGHKSSDGTTFPDRVRSYYEGGYIAENCAYGCETALEVVMQLLVDEGVPSLGHRKNILNPQIVAIGVATRQHLEWRCITVQDFGDRLNTPQPTAE